MLVLTQAIGIGEGFEVDFVIASIFSEPLNFVSQVGKRTDILSYRSAENFRTRLVNR